MSYRDNVRKPNSSSSSSGSDVHPSNRPSRPGAPLPGLVAGPSTGAVPIGGPPEPGLLGPVETPPAMKNQAEELQKQTRAKDEKRERERKEREANASKPAPTQGKGTVGVSAAKRTPLPSAPPRNWEDAQRLMQARRALERARENRVAFAGTQTVSSAIQTSGSPSTGEQPVIQQTTTVTTTRPYQNPDMLPPPQPVGTRSGRPDVLGAARPPTPAAVPRPVRSASPQSQPSASSSSGRGSQPKVSSPSSQALPRRRTVGTERPSSKQASSSSLDSPALGTSPQSVKRKASGAGGPPSKKAPSSSPDAPPRGILKKSASGTVRRPSRRSPSPSPSDPSSSVSLVKERPSAPRRLQASRTSPGGRDVPRQSIEGHNGTPPARSSSSSVLPDDSASHYRGSPPQQTPTPTNRKAPRSGSVFRSMTPNPTPTTSTTAEINLLSEDELAGDGESQKGGESGPGSGLEQGEEKARRETSTALNQSSKSSKSDISKSSSRSRHGSAPMDIETDSDQTEPESSPQSSPDQVQGPSNTTTGRGVQVPGGENGSRGPRVGPMGTRRGPGGFRGEQGGTGGGVSGPTGPPGGHQRNQNGAHGGAQAGSRPRYELRSWTRQNSRQAAPRSAPAPIPDAAYAALNAAQNRWRAAHTLRRQRLRQERARRVAQGIVVPPTAPAPALGMAKVKTRRNGRTLRHLPPRGPNGKFI